MVAGNSLAAPSGHRQSRSFVAQTNGRIDLIFSQYKYSTLLPIDGGHPKMRVTTVSFLVKIKLDQMRALVKCIYPLARVSRNSLLLPNFVSRSMSIVVRSSSDR